MSAAEATTRELLPGLRITDRALVRRISGCRCPANPRVSATSAGRADRRLDQLPGNVVNGNVAHGVGDPRTSRLPAGGGRPETAAGHRREKEFGLFHRSRAPVSRTIETISDVTGRGSSAVNDPGEIDAYMGSVVECTGARR